MLSQNDFVQLVSRMRDAQKAYFRGRTSMDLSRSKQLEKQVDAELSQYTTANGKLVAQPSLFDEQPAHQPAKTYKPVLVMRCKHCKATFLMHALAYPMDGETAQAFARAVQSGDEAFVANADEVHLQQCTCKPHP